MQLFADYVQPVTQWLYSHPHWALAITFLISFSESLAVIGSIVPGSVTMTAIGILAGSGVMRIDLTLLAATLGAIAGDSASYFLGYYYSDRIVRVWPFNRYPKVLEYGKQYFIHHGGKSVLIGRFAGPLRAMIPVIAGMMHMNRNRFLIANVLSAIGWSILYVMPGVLIGAASSELSAEVATRLFIFVLVGILVFWLAGICLRWLIVRLNIWLEKNLHYFWKFSGRHPLLQHIIAYITPDDEKNHYPTVFLIFTAILSFIFLLVITILVHNGEWIIQLNISLHYFFNSLRSNNFDSLFSIISFSYSSATLILIAASVALMSLMLKKYRLFVYWIIAIISTIVISGVLNNLIKSPYPSGNYLMQAGSSFPSLPLSLLIAMLTFSSLLMSRNILQWPAMLYRYFTVFLSLLTCLSALYLGDHWLSDVLASILIGLLCSLVTYLFYRREPYIRAISAYWILLLMFIWALGTLAGSFMYLQQTMQSHRLVFTKKIISMEQWWKQSVKPLPLYRKNRLGTPVDVLNIQYFGSLSVLEHHLAMAGWKRVNKSFWLVLLEKMEDSKHAMQLPILTQLYLNKKPKLIMVRRFDKQDFVLRIWESSYHIEREHLPVYVAALHPHHAQQRISTAEEKMLRKTLSELIHQTLTQLSASFDSKHIQIQFPHTIARKNLVPPYIYLIREKV